MIPERENLFGWIYETKFFFPLSSCIAIFHRKYLASAHPSRIIQIGLGVQRQNDIFANSFLASGRVQSYGMAIGKDGDLSEGVTEKSKREAMDTGYVSWRRNYKSWKRSKSS